MSVAPAPLARKLGASALIFWPPRGTSKWSENPLPPLPPWGRRCVARMSFWVSEVVFGSLFQTRGGILRVLGRPLGSPYTILYALGLFMDRLFVTR